MTKKISALSCLDIKSLYLFGGHNTTVKITGRPCGDSNWKPSTNMIDSYVL
jgi:hypothetical protein